MNVFFFLSVSIVTLFQKNVKYLSLFLGNRERGTGEGKRSPYLPTSPSPYLVGATITVIIIAIIETVFGAEEQTGNSK
ncbi:MAG: hypothetical protein WBB43_23475 [Limnoraphis sp.]